MPGFAFSGTGGIYAYRAAAPSSSIAHVVTQNAVLITQQVYITPNQSEMEIGIGGAHYYINRNNPQGLTIWNNAGAFYFNNMYNYRHWPADQYAAISIQNNNMDDIKVDMSLDDGSTTTQWYSNVFYGPGSDIQGPQALASYGVTAIAHQSASADFFWDWAVVNQTNPGVGSVQVDYYDYDTSALIYTQNLPLDASDTNRINYFQRASIVMTIN